MNHSGKLIIGGVDYSISSPAAVYAIVDDKFEPEYYIVHCLTSKKKQETIAGPKCNIQLKNWSIKDAIFSDDIDRFSWTASVIEHEFENVDYIAIEDYSFGSPGQLTRLAENAILLKHRFYEHGAKLRLYAIARHKKCSTGRGESDKLSMWRWYKDKEGDPLKLLEYGFSEVEQGNGISPESDIVDAYSILKTLLIELKLRNNIIKKEDLTKEQQEIFFPKSKKIISPLSEEFIYKHE